MEGLRCITGLVLVGSFRHHAHCMADPIKAADSGATRTATLGRVIFAASLVALGITGLVRKDFVPVWTGVPKGFPARATVAWLCAFISLGSGLGLMWRRTAAIASRMLLGFLALWMLLFRLPLLVRAPRASEAWWVCGETAVMMAGAWVLFVWFAGDRVGSRLGFATGNRGLRIASGLYGVGLIPFGVAHFTFLQRTVSMVPAWLPWHLAWAYFTGTAFVVAGVAIVLGRFGRLAATLSALQMGLFTLLVWGPILIAGPDAANWDEIVDSWALTAAGWLVAESYRGGSTR
jgi:uncharacterized membrane protein